MANSYFVHSSSVIDDPCTIGEGTKIWHFCHIMKDCVIGDNCVLGQNVVIFSGVTLGSNTKIQNNVSVYTGVTCEEDVFLGPSMVFTNILNPRSAVSRKDDFRKTLVKKGATIGANATVICGNIIGEFAMVGAGAVITRDVKPYALVLGNPARHAGWVSEYGHRLHFSEKGLAECPESKQVYQLDNEVVTKINEPYS
ncbi:MAG: acyltransferase [Chitinophagaceae bacterium]